MELYASLAIIAFAALIHASFQVSVSVLTLMKSHAFGRQTSRRRLRMMTFGFGLGAATMSVLLVTSAAYVAVVLWQGVISEVLWVALCGVLVGLAVSVWLFYYRHEKGTQLWLPRLLADFLAKQARRVHYAVEAFHLGLMSVAAETLFLIGPIVATAFILIELPPLWQLLGIVLYAFVAQIPLFVMAIAAGNGHSVGRMQKWREANKQALQVLAGLGLLALASYLYVDKVVVDIAGLGAPL